MSNLYGIAKEVTDEVMGEGTYARLNAGNPDPGVQAAIQNESAKPGRWDIPAGAIGFAPDDPDGDGLSLCAVSGGVRRVHLCRPDAYATALCGVDTSMLATGVGPGHTLCRDCALVAGVDKAADLDVDEKEAKWWAAQS